MSTPIAKFQRALEGYQAGRVPELAYRQRMIELLKKSNENSVKRSNFPAHFTASAFIVTRDRENVCLVLHKKFGTWLQPGGHIEDADNFDIQMAALREAREETGLPIVIEDVSPTIFDVDIHSISARKNEPEHEHFDVRFLIETNLSVEREWHCDGTTVKWFGVNEALERVSDESVRGLLRKLRPKAEIQRQIQHL